MENINGAVKVANHNKLSVIVSITVFLLLSV